MRHIDFQLCKNYPNKYHLTPARIKQLKILDWPRLKKHTWQNHAMTNGTWWCHLEGCTLNGTYNDEDEFWVGFNEDNNRINYHFTAYGGMCDYKFKEFYQPQDIDNEYDLNVQVNTIRWLNMMIDRKILGF